MGGRHCAINSPRGSQWGQKSRDRRSRDFWPHRGPCTFAIEYPIHHYINQWHPNLYLRKSKSSLISLVYIHTRVVNLIQIKRIWQEISSSGLFLCCELDRLTGTAWLLTHWGQVMHICVGNLTIIGPDNGLSPSRRQAIIWTNAGILLIGHWGTDFSEILIGIQTFSFKKMHLKMSSAKWRPFCLGLNVLMTLFVSAHLYQRHWALSDYGNWIKHPITLKSLSANLLRLGELIQENVFSIQLNSNVDNLYVLWKW